MHSVVSHHGDSYSPEWTIEDGTQGAALTELEDDARAVCDGVDDAEHAHEARVLQPHAYRHLFLDGGTHRLRKLLPAAEDLEGNVGGLSLPRKAVLMHSLSTLTALT